ncbi:MAG: hypothetical protein U1E76_06035 [Planctomycetota bacterium]
MRTLPRSRVIDDLRKHLVSLTSEKHSICDVAATLGIFCQGFRRLGDAELRRKFDWIVRTRPGITRAQLEDLANRYNLARQEALEVPISCDAKMIDRDTCVGWDEFTDADLARFYREWYREEIEVAPDA